MLRHDERPGGELCMSEGARVDMAIHDIGPFQPQKYLVPILSADVRRVLKMMFLHTQMPGFVFRVSLHGVGQRDPDPGVIFLTDVQNLHITIPFPFEPFPDALSLCAH